MMLIYRVELEPDDNGTFLVTCPAIPGVVTYGETREEALAQAVDAIETMLASIMADGEDIPAPERRAAPDPEAGLVRLPFLTSIKTILYSQMRREGVNRAELARRLGWHREQVDRLFRLDHNSRVDQLEAAFAAIGHRIEKDLRNAA